MRILAALGAVAALSAGVGCDRASTAPTGPSAPPGRQSTFLRFTSDPGDWVGQGRSRTVLPDPTARFGGDMWNDNNQLSFFVLTSGPGARDWGLLMQAPRGERLTPGVYRNARRIPAIGSNDPQLSFYGEQRSCNESIGEFEVIEALYGPKPAGSGTSGTIERFHARFTQACDGSTALLRGEVFLTAIERGCKATGNCG